MTEQQVKPEDLRAGDRVTITFPAKVTQTDRGLSVEVIGGHRVETDFAPSDLPHLTITRLPKPLEVGDRVRRRGGACPLTVLGTKGEWAWLEDGEGSQVIEALSLLTRIEG